MLSCGMFSALAARIAVRSRGWPSGSPPPRAAMEISLIRRVKILPRLASSAPFLCLMVAHLEWPDIGPLQLSEVCRPACHRARSKRHNPLPGHSIVALGRRTQHRATGCRVTRSDLVRDTWRKATIDALISRCRSLIRPDGADESE